MSALMLLGNLELRVDRPGSSWFGAGSGSHGVESKVFVTGDDVPSPSGSPGFRIGQQTSRLPARLAQVEIPQTEQRREYQRRRLLLLGERWSGVCYGTESGGFCKHRIVAAGTDSGHITGAGLVAAVGFGVRHTRKLLRGTGD